MSFKTPQELIDAYTNGLKAAECDPEDTAKLLGELRHPLFGISAYPLDFSGAGKLSLPWLSLLKFVPDFGPSERQTDSDCVSHATRNVIDISRAVEIDRKGEIEGFIARGATEAIYQARDHYGRGMSCSGAARYVRQRGGILLRKDYGDIDLSKYNSSVGARHRVPDSIFITEAKKHQVKTASLITSTSEVRDALANGYAVSVCSGQGFSSSRDKNGIARPKGHWAHAMSIIGCDDTHEIFNEILFLIQNSWGVWNNGPKRHNQPDGSFWIREEVMADMLSARGSFVFSDVDGFPARQLPEYGLGGWV